MVQLKVILVPVLVLSLLASVTATDQQRPECNPIKRPDGTAEYKLSRSDWTESCSTYWERKDGTKLAQNLDPYLKLTESVTQDSIVLKKCEPYLRFFWQCSGYRQNVECKIDCSAVPEPNISITPETPTSKICLSETFCVDPLNFGLFVGFVISFIILSIGALCIWKKCSERRRQVALDRAVSKDERRGERGDRDIVVYDRVRMEDGEVKIDLN